MVVFSIFFLFVSFMAIVISMPPYHSALLCNSGSSDLVSACEAQTAAERMGCLYQETSAQTGELVAAAFETAVKLGHTKRKDEDEQSQRSQILNNGFDPTWIPPMSE